MKHVVLLTETAERQIEEIASYIEGQFGTKEYNKFIGRVESAINGLSTMPFKWRESVHRPGLRKCLATPKTVMLFRVRGKTVTIVAVLDGRRIA